MLYIHKSKETHLLRQTHNTYQQTDKKDYMTTCFIYICIKSRHTCAYTYKHYTRHSTSHTCSLSHIHVHTYTHILTLTQTYKIIQSDTVSILLLSIQLHPLPITFSLHLISVSCRLVR